MRNEAMKRKLATGEAIDVRTVGHPIEEEDERVFELREFKQDTDYCDATLEKWIWSIGVEIETGLIHAAVDARFYQNPKYACVFLR